MKYKRKEIYIISFSHDSEFFFLCQINNFDLSIGQFCRWSLPLIVTELQQRKTWRTTKILLWRFQLQQQESGNVVLLNLLPQTLFCSVQSCFIRIFMVNKPYINGVQTNLRETLTGTTILSLRNHPATFGISIIPALL